MSSLFENKVSVVMATYNGASFIEEQIISILNQSRQVDKIYIVDDASTDETVDLIKRIIPTDRLVLYINSTNQGSNKSFEKAICLAEEEFIFISDQDDIWKHNKVEEMMEHALDSGFGLICSDAEIIDEFGLVICKSEAIYWGRDKLFSSSLSLLFTNCFSGHNMLIKKSLAIQAMPFPKNGMHYDHCLAMYALSDSTLFNCTSKLASHRVHSKNQVSKCHNKSIIRRSSRLQRFINLQGSFYDFAKYACQLNNFNKLNFFGKLLVLHVENKLSIFNIKLFIIMIINRDNIFPFDKGFKRIRKIKNYCLGRRGYFL